MSDDFPPTGFKATGITGVEEYIKSKSYKEVVKCPNCEQLRTELDKMKPVYDDAVFLAEPTMLLSLSRYTNNGASVVNTVAIERLANAVRVSMEVDPETYKKEFES